MKPKYIPVKQYAQELGISIQAVYKAIREGRLKAKKLGTLVEQNQETI